MARSRNIKPNFFANDELAEIDPLGRILFIGLWTIADFKGDLVWRERRIKALLLPYDECDIKELAISLDKYGFIRFYSDGEKIYLNVVNFDKHQNPHKNEKLKGSDIPKYSNDLSQLIDLKGLTINRDLSGQKRNDSQTNPADSLNLIPDSLNLIPSKKQSRFKPPSLEEVRDYCNTRNNNTNPQAFIDHYEANGWIRGKTKIKSWKACVRTWEQNHNNSNSNELDFDSTGWAE